VLVVDKHKEALRFYEFASITGNWE